MRMTLRRMAFVGFALLSTVGVRAQAPPAVHLAWDANVGDSTTGYKVFVGTAPSAYTRILDVGAAIDVVVDKLVPGTPYYFVVKAYDAAGETSDPSTEVTATTLPQPPPIDPACVVPTGAHAIQVFVTGLLQTGSGQGGSKARLDFQLGSPGSPIVRSAVQANGVDLAVMTGTDLTALGAMWFSLPTVPGVYTFGVTAANLAGCVVTQPTTRTVTIQ